jgi:hypothetical protein
MWQRIGDAHRSAIPGLFINPALRELEAFCDLLRGEDFYRA